MAASRTALSAVNPCKTRTVLFNWRMATCVPAGILFRYLMDCFLATSRFSGVPTKRSTNPVATSSSISTFTAPVVGACG